MACHGMMLWHGGWWYVRVQRRSVASPHRSRHCHLSFVGCGMGAYRVLVCWWLKIKDVLVIFSCCYYRVKEDY